jgi:hypothetical protein
MRARFTFVSAALIVAISAGSVAGQQRSRESRRPVPDTGMVGIGGSVGIAPPTETSFTNGPALTFNGEGYVSPRVSVRGQLSGAWWDITGRGFTGTVQPVALDGNVVYNWEGGAVHPFITGGIGLYHYRFNEGGTTGTANKPGVNVGGGAEFFTNRHTTVTAEALFHATNRPVTSPATTYNDARFWTLTAGLKRYF